MCYDKFLKKNKKKRNRKKKIHVIFAKVYEKTNNKAF